MVEEDFNPFNAHAEYIEFKDRYGEDPEGNVNLTDFFYFKRISYFKNGIKFDYSEKMIDMSTMYVII